MPPIPMTSMSNALERTHWQCSGNTALAKDPGRLAVCYATTSAISDHRAYSGTVHNIYRSLLECGLNVEVLDRLQYHRLLLGRARMRIDGLLSASNTYQVERARDMAKRIGQDIARHLDHNPADVVFSNSSLPLAMLDHDVPKVFYTDATFKALRELYPELRNYPLQRAEEGEELERMAIQRADRLVYASEWAAASAVRDYGADPTKVRVVPRGSGLTPPYDREEVARFVDARSRERCELLLIGVSWERKGGPLAAEILDLLNSAGIDARLTVVGCMPPKGTDRSRMEIHPFLDNAREPGLGRLLSLFKRSHFLVVPSQAECFGIVYAEGSSMGLPSIARESGGVRDAVVDGANGYVLQHDAPASAYVERITSLWNDPRTYKHLCMSSFDTYVTRLNWSRVGHQLTGILKEAAARHKGHAA